VGFGVGTRSKMSFVRVRRRRVNNTIKAGKMWARFI